jgi:hypothetical protein
MPEEVFAIAIVSIIFIGFPAVMFHYITQWRKQKTLMPDDERMMEDLWRSAKADGAPDRNTRTPARSGGGGGTPFAASPLPPHF